MKESISSERWYRICVSVKIQSRRRHLVDSPESSARPHLSSARLMSDPVPQSPRIRASFSMAGAENGGVGVTATSGMLQERIAPSKHSGIYP